MYISIVRFITALGKSVYDTTSRGIDKIVDKITLSLNMHVYIRIEKKKTFQFIYRVICVTIPLCYLNALRHFCHLNARTHTPPQSYILFHLRHYSIKGAIKLF